MKNKILIIAGALLVSSLMFTSIALAKPWTYPKNNDKFEEFWVAFEFDFVNAIVPATEAAILEMKNPNKLVITFDEIPVNYEIRIGEDGPDQRSYLLGEDFTYSGVATFTVFNPILPYDPFSNLPASLFLAGDFQHFRVDYVYDFGDDGDGPDGTLTMLALITGNTVFLSGEKPMWITSLQGTGDFKNVNIKSTAITPNHLGIVSGWPE